MSVHLIGSIYRHQFTKTQQIILLAMADEVRKGMTTCWPSAMTVGWKTGYSERHVRRIWQQLESMGVMVRAGVSHYGTIIWRIDPTTAPAKPERMTRRGAVQDIQMTDPPRPEDRTLTLPASDIPASSPGHQMTDEPRSPEPHKENQCQDLGRGSRGQGRDVSDLSDSELADVERAALADFQQTEDQLRRAERQGRRLEVARRQAVHDEAVKRFLLIRQERMRRAAGPCGIPPESRYDGRRVSDRGNSSISSPLVAYTGQGGR